jgi:hypothetical protein
LVALAAVRSWNTKPSPFEENPKGISSVAALLDTVADAVIVVLRRDQCDRDIGL